MKKRILFFILIFLFIFSYLSATQAQTITPLPKTTNIISENNNVEFNILINLLKMIFGFKTENSFPNNQNTSTTFNNQNNPNNSSITITLNPNITLNPTISLNNLNVINNKINPDVNNLIYYSQCKGPYDNYPLPQGGTICKAGCGPTTVSMILASYVDKNINPPKVVDEYRIKRYYLGPNGSYYFDAEKILKSYGLKTTYIFADNRPRTVNQVMESFGSIIKNYQNSGWTFFALANFCNAGCGHYFWIIKIDENLNIWSYDPAYDIKSPKPINHKVRYPFPKFKVIFGVKK